jgi:OFA family oxalate/formate antiporter-like MFS transporter
MRNRYLIALAAVAIHLSIGSVYAYSVLKNPLGDFGLGWGKIAVTGSFSVAIAFLGLSAAFLGPFVEKYGPRVAGTVAGVLYGAGISVAGLAVALDMLPLFYLGYGVLGGMGLGVGYIAPVSTLVRYFPDRRGLATGLAIMGFGFGALLYAPIMARLLEAWPTSTIELQMTAAEFSSATAHGAPYALAAGTTLPVDQSANVLVTKTVFAYHFMFWILGPLWGLVMIAAAQYLKKPTEEQMLQFSHKKPDANTRPISSGILGSLTVGEAIRTPQFYGLWIMLYINVTCGIAVVSAASPLLQGNVGLTAAAAAGITGLLGLFNGVGRIAWASASDFLGRTSTYATFFALQIVAFALLPTIQSAMIFQIVLFLILTCYGGGFATIPAFIGDLFGTKQLGAIHGCVLTAWSAAGLTGPLAYTWLKESTGSITTSMYLFAGLFVIALITSVALGLSLRKHQEEPMRSGTAALA